MEDLDHEVTARLGLKFTLPGGKPKNGGNGSD
jgi:hypothetical protein